MRNRSLLWAFLLFALSLSAQQRVRFTHYTSDDGLSQNRVMDIHQDSKGYMWFATWDGLNKFDGRHFRVFKGFPGDPNGFTNNRLNSIQEDAFGYLWLLTNDFQVYRFNPRTEQFRKLSYQPDKGKPVVTRPIQFIRLVGKSDVFLLTYGDGCYHLSIDENGDLLDELRYLSVGNGALAGNDVREVFTDRSGIYWFLTQQGLTRLDNKNQKNHHFFRQVEQENAFLSHLETKDGIYFGAQNGQIWLWKPKTSQFELMALKSTAPVNGFCTLRNGQLLVITGGDGVYLCDLNLNVVRHFDLKNTPSLASNLIHSFYLDMAGDVWLEADARGVVLYETQKRIFHHFQPQSDEQFGLAQLQPNFFVVEDNADHLWVHPRSGGFSEFSRKEMQLKPFYNDPADPNRRFMNTMHAAYYDKQGNLWLSTRSPGLEKCTFQQPTIAFTPVTSLLQKHGGSEVRTIAEDRRGRLWVADRDGGIQIRTLDNRLIGYLDANGKVSSSRQQANFFAYDILFDHKGRIWIASKGTGIILLEEADAAGMRYNVRYLNSFLPPASRPNSNNFYCLLQDKKGRIWAGSYGGGLNLVDESQGDIRFIHVQNGLSKYPISSCRNVRHMAIDNKGIVWLGTVNGIVAFDSNFKNLSDIRFYEYRKEGNEPKSLRTNDVHYVYVDAAGNRWFGTFGGGLNRLPASFRLGEKPLFDVVNMAQGLPSDIILCIIEDIQGSCWLFSENSVTRYDPSNGNMDLYNKDNGLENVTFSESSAFRASNGSIFAGTTSGFIHFDPSRMKTATFVPKLIFSRFFVFNEECLIGAEDSPLKRNVDEIGTIELKHRQNVFTIEFAALDYRAPENIQYAYRLDPVDHNWTNTRKLNSVTYTNLAPGEYTFRVKSTNSEGYWMNNERSLVLIVRPSFWQTPFAIMLYIVFGLVLFALALYFSVTIYRLRTEVDVEQKVSQMKMNFFTDISHELRTPLSLIAGPVDHLSEYETNLSAEGRILLDTVRRNIDRMMRLINQLLDFRKIQDKKMQLKVQETNLGEFVTKAASNFKVNAEEKKINFLINDQTGGTLVWIDRDKVDTIVYNLLSNAFKFTLSGKTVSVSLLIEGQDVLLVFSDQGVGIPADKLNRLFERFYSYDETSNIRGTGIGLSLVKELVEMHGGKISVTSQEGSGTTFEIRFPLGTAHFGNDVILVQTDTRESSDDLLPDPRPEAQLSDNGEAGSEEGKTAEVVDTVNQPLMLVVEDNDELRKFLTGVLSKKFRVADASEGLSAWNMVGNLMPDFIITDLMMPVMDGLELTRRIREDGRTCHIPVVILTAKSDQVTQLESLEAGVTDFIAKPFSAAYLEAKIDNILKQREILQDKFRQEFFSVRPLVTSNLNLPSQDSVFLQRIMDFMEENMSNSELTVDQLVSVAGMGRTVFFNKLKGLMGLSPIEFIKETRIKRAAQLLDSGHFNVSEVSFQIGMNDARYFSKCFKQKYGMTPTEYKNKSIHKSL